MKRPSSSVSDVRVEYDTEIGNVPFREVVRKVIVRNASRRGIQMSDASLDFKADSQCSSYGAVCAGFENEWAVKVGGVVRTSIHDYLCDRLGMTQREVKTRMLCDLAFKNRYCAGYERVMSDADKSSGAFVYSFNDTVLEAVLNSLLDGDERRMLRDRDWMFREIEGR